MEAFEQCARMVLSMLAVESMGGKEVFDYAILKETICPGILYGIGVQAAWTWK